RPSPHPWRQTPQDADDGWYRRLVADEQHVLLDLVGSEDRPLIEQRHPVPRRRGLCPGRQRPRPRIAMLAMHDDVDVEFGPGSAPGPWPVGGTGPGVGNGGGAHPRTLIFGRRLVLPAPIVVVVAGGQSHAPVTLTREEQPEPLVVPLVG